MLNLPLLPTRPRGRPRKRPRTVTPVRDNVTDDESDNLSRKSADEVEPEPDPGEGDEEDEDVVPAQEDSVDVDHDDEMVHGLLQETYEAESVAEEPVAGKPVPKVAPVGHYQVRRGPGLRGLYFPPAYSKEIQNASRG